MTITEFSEKLHFFSRTEPPVLACIGSTRVLSDCFGPLVGTLLTERYATFAHVYGTLSNPIHAMNLQSRISELKARHPHNKLIAVDSFIGKNGIGSILPIDGPIKPGLASGKNLPLIGDLSLIGCTQTDSQKADLGHIFTLAQKTADILQSALFWQNSFSKEPTAFPYVPFGEILA